MPFTEKETEYLKSQHFGRLATIGRNGTPHNVPVGVHLNTELGTIDVVGRGLGKSRKYRDVQLNEAVAFVVDDLASVDPLTPRGIEIRGLARALTEGGHDNAMIRIVPTRIISWGIEGHWSEGPAARDVAVEAPSA
ncbi:PPOX class F420-dependent oxidoreductase [Amycolatopsis sp. NPDC049688]|uniref:PPOX class F420-dependent oxidoreductase n=1 Tax=Amycolatopsis sp. NPDC049688 TaxID=3154733 RepID=UPI0034291BCE